MALDSQLKAYAEQLAARGDPPRHTVSPQVARAMRAADLAADLAAGLVRPEPVSHVEDRTIDAPASPIALRIYTPRGVGPFAIVVYFHGGGWVLGNLASHDSHCRSIANGAGCVVVAVDYRLAPEHTFPAAPEDCYAATRWASEHVAELNGDAARLVVAGDSAGGNLATVVALMARERGGPPLAFQLLIYPITDARMLTDSYVTNADAPMLTRADMAWFRAHYLRDDDDVTNPLVSPLLAADLDGLPPALVVTAEFDTLRDEGELYAMRLQAAGVPTMVRHYDGLAHGFFGYDLIVERAKQAKTEIITALHDALASVPTASSVTTAPTAPDA